MGTVFRDEYYVLNNSFVRVPVHDDRSERVRILGRPGDMVGKNSALNNTPARFRVATLPWLYSHFSRDDDEVVDAALARKLEAGIHGGYAHDVLEALDIPMTAS